MLTKTKKTQFRSLLFRHLDGIATCTTAFALYKKGVLKYLLELKKVELKKLSKEFSANEGYLNVALRTMSSQGWLVQLVNNEDNTITYEINENSAKAFKLIPLYSDAIKLLDYSVHFPEDGIGSDCFIALDHIFKKYEDNFGLQNVEKNSIEFQILKHIEGVIIGPIIVLLGVNGLFHKYFMEASFSWWGTRPGSK